MSHPDPQEQLKSVGDLLSLGTVVATLTTWLPPVAALFTIVWTLIRIYETETVQRLLSKWRRK